MIRDATTADIDRLVPLAAKFFASGDAWQPPPVLEPEHFGAHLSAMIEAPQVGFFVDQRTDGSLAGAFVIIAHPNVFSGELAALKLHWIAEPDSIGTGLRLLRHAGRWAAQRGAKDFYVSAINDNSARILERLGFAECERVFHKAL